MTVPTNLKSARAFAKSVAPEDRASLEALRLTPTLTNAGAVACIQALALVGGPVALEVVSSYADPPDRLRGRFGGTYTDKMTAALLLAWTKFPGPDFVRAMFSNEQRLHLSSGGVLETMDGLDAAPHLEVFDASLGGKCDISPLQHCPRIRELSLGFHRKGHASLDPLVNVAGLRRLDIHGDGLDDELAELLPKLRQVERVGVAFHGAGRFASLAEMPKLARVELSLRQPHRKGVYHREDDQTRPCAADWEALRAMVARDVQLLLWAHQPWTADVEAQLPDAQVATEFGYVIVFNRSSDRDLLVEAARTKRFLRDDRPDAGLTTKPPSRPW